MSSSLSHPNYSDDTFQNFLSRILKILAAGMVLSSFTAYITAKYVSLLNMPVISLPFSAFLSTIPVITLSSFLLLLIVCFVAEDGYSKLNLDRPKAGMFLFSVLFGVFLGSLLQEVISAFLIVYLSGAFFFLILALYKSWSKQEEDSLDSLIFGKYVIILIAILFNIMTGGSFWEISFTIVGMLFLAFIYFLCTFELEKVYHYYKQSKSRVDLNYIGAFKLYKAFLRCIWVLPTYYSSRSLYLELVKVPKDKKVEREVDEPLERDQEISTKSSEELLTKYIETTQSTYAEKNTRNIL